MKPVSKKLPPSHAQIKLVDIGVLLENCHWYVENTLKLIKKSRKEIDNFKARESRLPNTKKKTIKK